MRCHCNYIIYADPIITVLNVCKKIILILCHDPFNVRHSLGISENINVFFYTFLSSYSERVFRSIKIKYRKIRLLVITINYYWYLKTLYHSTFFFT